VLPVAANLVALLPYQKEDMGMVKAFRGNVFTGSVLLPRTTFKFIFPDDSRDSSSPVKTKIMAYDTLPEVHKFM
jgi:hypothetical protein